ncbi:MAG: radical SAM protein [Coriobacteriia bacterium]|nr:radical SAM protein [Coriobacteriia bacterium]
MKLQNRVKKVALDKLIDYLLENPEENIPKVMKGFDDLAPDSLFPSQRKAFRTAIEEENNWYQLLLRLTHLNPEVVGDLLKAFVVDANFLAWNTQEGMREKYQCNIPWAILLDPTSACNLHCTGCWAAEYGHSLNLTLDDIDSIIQQGRELGVHIYIYTGGEPLVRKKDLIILCERYPDCAFLCFTNATLIDEAFCQEMIRVKNFVPAISAEGFEEATDARRGAGTYQKVSKAMDLLNAHGLPFGVSCCYTNANAYSIASEEFFDWLISKGALFAWIFTYMPVGANASADLMVQAKQRVHLYNFVRDMRSKKPLLTLDFQNDGEFVGGCIAGGRRYLHINAAGDVEPCVFAHYSNANIHDVSLLDALRSPLFMAYYEGQPFSDNLLRPCPILENKDALAEMVERTGAHSTDLEQPEDPRDLCARCHQVIEEWDVVSEQLWTNPEDPFFEKRHNPNQGMADTDIAKFDRLGRTIKPMEE